jgi:16S rRNA G1207 methylase RsmC
VELQAEGTSPAPGTFDVVLANPPYFSQEHVARLFVSAAQFALHERGRLYLVTKKVDWFEAILPDYFATVTSDFARGYMVFTARK